MSRCAQGTIATVRNPSLTSVANRYVDLRLAPGNAPPIPNGGTIGTTYTNSAVDLDELFNTLNPPTRKALQNVIQGSAIAVLRVDLEHRLQRLRRQGAGRLAIPEPGSRLRQRAVLRAQPRHGQVHQLHHQDRQPVLDDRHAPVGSLGADPAPVERRPPRSPTSTSRWARRSSACPGFMRLANTTFVNLRGALDDLTAAGRRSQSPSRPSSSSCSSSCARSRRTPSRPSRISRRSSTSPGREQRPDRPDRAGRAARGRHRPARSANGKTRAGAFPESTTALNDSTPELADFRPYAVDLTGWFEDYSHPGIIDANGGVNRAEIVIGAYTLAPGGAGSSRCRRSSQDLTNANNPFLQSGALQTGIGDRCPGLDGARRGLTTPRPASPVTRSRCRPGHEAAARSRSPCCSPPRRSVVFVARRDERVGLGDPTYKVELDNSFGLVNGEQFKVAGRARGDDQRRSTSATPTRRRTARARSHALVTVQVTQSGFGSFH